MRIINIDALNKHVELFVSKRIPTYVRSFLEPQERKYYGEFQKYQDISTQCPVSPVRKFECGWYENIAVLWHTIPIYLRDKRPEIGHDNDCKSIIDPLGAYFPNRHGDDPYIELYLTDIYGAAEDFYEMYKDKTLLDTKPSVKEGFKFLSTIVLLHELAHAALDIFNLEDTPKSEMVSYKTEFGKWREESMANAVALRIIREKALLVQDRENGETYINPNGVELTNNITIYNYAKRFMELQPAEYALGVLMEEFDDDDFRSVFYAKTNGVNMDLQKEWLEYAKGDPDWAGLQKWNVLLDSQYVYLFEGKYYSSEQEIVYDIVNKTLSDYESKNGSKMSSSTFTSIFPYIRTGVGMSYKPTHTVVEDNRYQNEMQLADGNYSLYNFWDNVSLHRFIDTKKLGIIEYKNY
jgi:hypothetical protein